MLAAAIAGKDGAASLIKHVKPHPLSVRRAHHRKDMMLEMTGKGREFPCSGTELPFQIQHQQTAREMIHEMTELYHAPGTPGLRRFRRWCIHFFSLADVVSCCLHRCITRTQGVTIPARGIFRRKYSGASAAGGTGSKRGARRISEMIWQPACAYNARMDSEKGKCL
jgi:hypothetical protein